MSHVVGGGVERLQGAVAPASQHLGRQLRGRRLDDLACLGLGQHVHSCLMHLAHKKSLVIEAVEGLAGGVAGSSADGCGGELYAVAQQAWQHREAPSLDSQEDAIDEGEALVGEAIAHFELQRAVEMAVAAVRAVPDTLLTCMLALLLSPSATVARMSAWRRLRLA